MSQKNIYTTLKKYFGYDEFRSGQKQVIEQILLGKDCVAIMPTGAGKSICFQIPALMFEGLTLVISPLISLMKDQVDALLQMGIESAYINSTLSSEDYFDIIRGIRKNKYKLIYVAPERLEMEGFLNMINEINISMIAVDEAHCVSQWGHDFRPSYTRIIHMIKGLRKRPVIAAFTATATPIVKMDIVKLLDLQKPFSLTTGFDRENLYFEVKKPEDRFSFLKKYLKEHSKETGIIYCSTRKTVDSLYEKLNKSGFSVAKYHAGLSDAQRTKSQEALIFDRVNILIATNAFGMGIDKSNIRYVIHYNMPKNMESYYQEAGRAGRDSLPSNCVLLYSSADIITNKFLIEQGSENQDKSGEYQKLNDMVAYCNTDRCLRYYILDYFGEKAQSDHCGHCSNCNSEIEKQDITIEAQKIMSCIKRVNERFGSSVVTDILKGAKTEKIQSFKFNQLTTYGIMKEYKKETIKEIIAYLVSQDLIRLQGEKYPILTLTQGSYEVLKGQNKVYIKRMLQMQTKKEEKSTQVMHTGLFESLKQLRMELAKKHHVPPFVVFSDATLQEMCMKCPIDEVHFLQISGVGAYKYEKYGQFFIDVISKSIQDPENTLSK